MVRKIMCLDFPRIYLKEFVFSFLFCLIFFVFPNIAQAKNCGDGVAACACGDTVISSTTLTSDLICATNGLIVGASSITIDGNGHTITGSGGILYAGIGNLSGYSNVTIKNFAAIASFGKGISLSSATGTLVQNNTIRSTSYGIYSSSASTTFTGNTVYSNTYGIYLTSSSNILSNNTIQSNVYGMYLSSAANNTLENNIVSRNTYEIYGFGAGTYSNNQLLYNGTSSAMLTFTEVTRTKNINDTVNFNISMLDANGSSCPDCNYSITTSPSETVNISKTDNDIAGSFTVTRLGTYSLNFIITDSNNNITKRNYLFFVGDTTPKTTKYYMRMTVPVHGQPTGNEHDVAYFLLTPPTGDEWGYCAQWTQHYPDEIPDFPLAYLSDVNIYFWYKVSSVGDISLQKFGSYGQAIDNDPDLGRRDEVLSAAGYTWVNKNFSSLGWGIDYLRSWYWLTFKLSGGAPYWFTSSASPSYTDFTHSYTTTPAVKTISNEDFNILSATSPASDADAATVVVQNPTTSAASTNIVLDSVTRPFLNASSTAISASTATITTPSIAADSTLSLESVAMDIVPSADSVSVAVTTWETSGNQHKEWTENSSSSSITTAHTIGGLTAGSYHALKVDGVTSGTYKANDSGQVTFTYSGGYSTHTFELDPYTSSSSSSNSSSSTDTACAKSVPTGTPNLYQIDPSLNSVTLYFTPVSGANSYYIRYGTTSDANQYATSFSHSDTSGAVAYTINNLAQGTKYYFTVRGGNGCATGNWSNTASQTTKQHALQDSVTNIAQSIIPQKKLNITSSKLTSKEPDKTTAKTKQGTKQTGTTLNVKVLAENNQPVAGVTVTLHSRVQTSTTNKEGIAHFENVEKGEHKVLLSYKGYNGEQKLTIDGTRKEQTLTLQVKMSNGFSSPVVLITVGVLIAVIVILLFTIFRKRKIFLKAG